jgi:hypothetical protein
MFRSIRTVPRNLSWGWQLFERWRQFSTAFSVEESRYFARPSCDSLVTPSHARRGHFGTIADPEQHERENAATTNTLDSRGSKSYHPKTAALMQNSGSIWTVVPPVGLEPTLCGF